MKTMFIKSMLVVVATITTSFLWLRYPTLFPSVSEQNAIFLVQYFETSNGEELADLEMYLVLGISFIVALVCMLVVTLSQKLLTKTSR